MLEMKVYIENADQGKEVTLPMDEQELIDIIYDLTVNGRSNCIVSDYDSSFGIEVNNNLFEVNSFLGKLNELGFKEDDKAFLNLFIRDYPTPDLEEIAEKLEEREYILFNDVDDKKDLGRKLFELYSARELDNFLEMYFDFERYADDLITNGNFLIDFNNKIAIEILN